MRFFALIFLVFALPINLPAQHDLTYYLPEGDTYDPSIPKPSDILGHEVGEWHVTHDKLVRYMEVLAEASPRIRIQEIGRTYENRPLQVLTISSPKNLARIEEIQSEHLQLSDPDASGGVDINDMPVVLFMGYSVHGNEASGSNAALISAYHFAAAENITADLEKVVILLHPSINPDGLNRFASWVNSHKSANLIADPNDHEHDEAWPGGRTNHYWFDLNRDWLPVQLPESQARMNFYHQWKPNVLTDHHEMGTNSTFFFQPGIPSRNHPLTPDRTYELTGKIAEFHAKELDEIGSLYYTKESFDDFYLGKGSAFPDVNGGVGILFEQASSRGHAQESVNGRLDFAFTIRNQFRTSISTFKAGIALRTDLLELMRSFYSESKSLYSSSPVKAYLFSSEKDPIRAAELAKVLNTHRIEIYRLSSDVRDNGKVFSKGSGYMIPLDQPQHRLIRGIFEKGTSFQDSLFYDVSSWTLPLAFNVDYAEVDAKAIRTVAKGERITSFELPSLVPEKSDYAYVFEWYPYHAAAALNHLLASGVRAKVADSRFTANGKEYDFGTILIPVATQSISSDKLHRLLSETSESYHIKVDALSTGLNQEGIDLGSPSFSSLRKPEVMMLVGEGVSSAESGEVWHLTDQRMNIKVSKLTMDRFNSADLSRYNTLIMVNGSYGSINAEKLKTWVTNGGVIIATKSATRWLASNGLSKAKFKGSQPDTVGNRSYEDISKYRGAQAIGGSIFMASLDTTHPLCYGYTSKELPIFRNSTLFLEKAANPYANPVVYSPNPLLSGYISETNYKRLQGSAIVTTSRLGRGRVIMITDNPNFRAFWYGTNKLFLNGLFFGNLISGSATE